MTGEMYKFLYRMKMNSVDCSGDAVWGARSWPSSTCL